MTGIGRGCLFSRDATPSFIDFGVQGRNELALPRGLVCCGSFAALLAEIGRPADGESALLFLSELHRHVQ